MVEYVLFEIGIVMISSAIIGAILFYLKQPLIFAYILAGILIGPFGLSLVIEPEFIHGISAIGIMLMLFLIGLEMSTTRLKELGAVSLIAGIGQVMFTGLAGFAIVKLFGFTTIESIYLSVALTFSSTVIAVKLISDQKDTNSLYGQICIGILIVQDTLAIIALLFLTGFKGGSFVFDYMHFGEVFIKGILLVIMAMLVANKVLKFIYSKIASSHELLVLFSLSWCFLIALLSMEIGFSMEIGAFIAGVSLANLPYAFEINIKAMVLRNFFITIFFVSLGTGMIFTSVTPIILPLIVLSLFVLIGNPIIVLFIMGRMGYDKRTAFFTGLTIANISEFSLVVIALGANLGHLEETVTSMVAIIAMITMVISSYMITYNNELYRFLKKHLSIFESKKKKNIFVKKKSFSNHIILLGCGQMGQQVLEQVLSFKEDYIVVDHSNYVIKRLMEKNIQCIFGDAEDDELLEELDFENAEVVISTLPSADNNNFFLKYLRKNIKNKPIVIVAADSAYGGMEMIKSGADYIILKSELGAQHIHHINRQIYGLGANLEHIQLFSDNKISSNEHEVVGVIHGLNEFRLKELKNKFNAQGG